MSLFGKHVPASLGELQSSINRLFEQVWHSGIKTGPLDGQDWAPLMDAVEKPDCYIVEVELPGMAPADLELTCVGTTLTLQGQKTKSPEMEGSEDTVLAERRYGSFRRTLTFEQALQPQGVTANMNNGVLRISVPKKTPSRSESVSVPIHE